MEFLRKKFISVMIIRVKKYQVSSLYMSKINSYLNIVESKSDVIFLRDMAKNITLEQNLLLFFYLRDVYIHKT